jgi:hypothetical protein
MTRSTRKGHYCVAFMPPKTAKTSKKSMSAQHKAALAEGREQGRAVRSYLEALDAHKPKRGRKRTPDSIRKRLAAIEGGLSDSTAYDRLHLLQEQADLEEELNQLEIVTDLSDLEAGFIDSAAAYSDRKGITYDTWRKMGIAPATLRAAGIKRGG